MKLAYLGLGSNLGDRDANLAQAAEHLESPEVKILRKSSIFETEPRDVPDQPWFLNQVLEVETSLLPRQFMHRLQRLEREMGRTPTRPKGPRVIDIDILLYGKFVISAADLEIPHPRMLERRFVLEPLAELAPQLRHPVKRETMLTLLGAVAGQVARRR